MQVLSYIRMQTTMRLKRKKRCKGLGFGKFGCRETAKGRAELIRFQI